MVVNKRDPDCPIAWPRATAPPLTFTRAESKPSSFIIATAWTANASFSSIKSTSLSDQPAFRNTLRIASTGAIITNAGSIPEVAWATMRAIGSTPNSRARSDDVTTSAEAPSLTPGAFPAVTVPPSFLNAGLSLARASSDVSSRTVSSESKTTAGPFFCGISTGTISSLKFPA